MSIRQRASALLFLLVWPMTKTAAAGFDVKTLAQLGYNADIAEFFNTARFLPGVHRVTLEVNAAQRYQEEVRFDAQGALCLDESLAQTLAVEGRPTSVMITPLSRYGFKQDAVTLAVK